MVFIKVCLVFIGLLRGFELDLDVILDVEEVVRGGGGGRVGGG